MQRHRLQMPRALQVSTKKQFQSKIRLFRRQQLRDKITEVPAVHPVAGMVVHPVEAEEHRQGI